MVMTFFELPSLDHGFEWRYRDGRPAACLFTLDVDCYIEVTEDGSVKIPTGVAPLDIVKAVIEVNERRDRNLKDAKIDEGDITHLEVLLNGEFSPLGWLYSNVYEHLKEKGLCVNSNSGYKLTRLGAEVLRKYELSKEEKEENGRENSERDK
jgi:hypothetical protein